ncbi:uncharacterized protein PV09_01856 [Verruconis gallopava]|uniref:Probable beta-glucosidase btgE n=1 Tax=Verruconis gallopava TaxID=253628 RepID=A0A0D2AN65_9PEZI|nr:uncharacterized protein PV09_01856 [Verruconis gallopava]KIW07955.1 hypothetical protein PV09_01856 [Verruconis gallopava]
MKAGIVALAAASLVGSAVAAPDYWPAASSSSPAAPVKPTTTEECEEEATSSAAGYWPAHASSSSVASWSAKAWPSSVASSSSAGSWPVKPVKSSSASAWAVPSYFETAWGCCKTVVTVTEYGSMAAKPTVWSTASPVSPVPVPVVTAWPSAGVYTQEAVTVTLTNTVTVVAHKSQALTSGTNVWGGSSVTVTAPTTVSCGYVAHTTSGSVLSEYVAWTTLGCESAGVYTCVPAATSSCSEETTITWAVPTEYAPGTWTLPATTVTATASGQIWECPFEQAKPTTSSTPAAPVVQPTWSSPAYVAPASPSATWAAPAASSSPATSYGSGSGSSISTNGNKWAMTYTPYTTTGQCKTAAEVDSDLASIKSYGFTTVRLYATDCSGLVNVGASAKSHGLKIILGVFIESSGLSAAWSQVEEIATWGSAGNWDNVVMIVVGNEAVFNGYCSASDLAAFITKAKGTWSAAGYSGWVTTTEPVNIIQQYASTLCSVVDVAAANIQPFFTSSVTSSSAGDFVAGQIALVEAACGKTAYNLECGWPSAGSSNGAAVPSKSDQKTAITDILAKAGDKTAIFSFENDAWKDAGAFGVEQNFGCSDLFGSSSSY